VYAYAFIKRFFGARVLRVVVYISGIAMMLIASQVLLLWHMAAR
jgi:hypothetical protein